MSLCQHNVSSEARCYLCEDIAEAENRVRDRFEHGLERHLPSAENAMHGFERELYESTATAAKARRQRIELLMRQAKAYAHCACPEDPKTGRVNYHSNCAAKLMPILNELEGLAGSPSRRPVGHITDNIRELEVWHERRARKRLDNKALATAIAFLKEYRALIAE